MTDKVTHLAQLLLFKGIISLQDYEDWRIGTRSRDINLPILKNHKEKLDKWLKEEREKRGIVIDDGEETKKELKKLVSEIVEISKSNNPFTQGRKKKTNDNKPNTV